MLGQYVDNFTSVRMNYNVNKREGAEKSVDDLRKRFIDVEHYITRQKVKPLRNFRMMSLKRQWTLAKKLIFKQ